VKACFHKQKNKKAAFREAEWSGSGKTNAKRIIADNPDEITFKAEFGLFFLFLKY
jgi:hypothetical protein